VATSSTRNVPGRCGRRRGSFFAWSVVHPKVVTSLGTTISSRPSDGHNGLPALPVQAGAMRIGHRQASDCLGAPVGSWSPRDAVCVAAVCANPYVTDTPVSNGTVSVGLRNGTAWYGPRERSVAPPQLIGDPEKRPRLMRSQPGKGYRCVDFVLSGRRRPWSSLALLSSSLSAGRASRL
jgi:hypothetical protein